MGDLRLSDVQDEILVPLKLRRLYQSARGETIDIENKKLSQNDFIISSASSKI